MIIIKTAPKADFAHDARLGSVVAEDADLEFARPYEPLLDDDAAVEAGRSLERSAQLGLVLGAADTDRRAQVGRFDEQRVGERAEFRQHLLRLSLPYGACDDAVGDSRQAVGAKNRFHHPLVHADGAPQNVRTDERQPHDL